MRERWRSDFPREAGEVASESGGMEDKTPREEEEPVVPDWTPGTLLQSDPSRVVVPEAADRPVRHGEGAEQAHQVEPRGLVGYTVVVAVLCRLERGGDDAVPRPRTPQWVGRDVVRCIGFMGVWSRVWSRVVPDPVAEVGAVSVVRDHRQGAAPNHGSHGQRWQGPTIRTWCDNVAVVAIVNSGTSKNPEAMHLRRCLVFLEARWQCQVVGAHVSGTDNPVADETKWLYSALSLRRPGEHSGGGVGCASGLEAGLDVPQLVRTVEELFREGLAPTTRRTYATGKRRYLRFCESLGLSPTPASEQVLQVFVASLARDGLAHSTVKNYLAAVKHLHLEKGLPDRYRNEPVHPQPLSYPPQHLSYPLNHQGHDYTL